MGLRSEGPEAMGEECGCGRMCNKPTIDLFANITVRIVAVKLPGSSDYCTSTYLVKSKSSSKTLPYTCVQVIDAVEASKVNEKRIGSARSHSEGCGAARCCIQAGARAKMTVLEMIHL